VNHNREAIAEKVGTDIAATLQSEFEAGDLKVEDFDKRLQQLFDEHADIPDILRMLYFRLDVRNTTIAALKALAEAGGAA